MQNVAEIFYHQMNTRKKSPPHFHLPMDLMLLWRFEQIICLYKCTCTLSCCLKENMNGLEYREFYTRIAGIMALFIKDIQRKLTFDRVGREVSLYGEYHLRTRKCTRYLGILITPPLRLKRILVITIRIITSCCLKYSSICLYLMFVDLVV